MSSSFSAIDARNEATYAIYLNLHFNRTAYPSKTLRVVISELMYADPSAWRAVGITRAALECYVRAGRRRIRGVQRAHLTSRAGMVEHVLERHEPLSQADLFSYWRLADCTIIALTSENLTNSFGDWIPIDNPNALYFPPAAIGFRFRNAVEGELVKRLAAQYIDGGMALPPSGQVGNR